MFYPLLTTALHGVQARPHVPYFESKLTLLLKGAFGGTWHPPILPMLVPEPQGWTFGL